MLQVKRAMPMWIQERAALFISQRAADSARRVGTAVCFDLRKFRMHQGFVSLADNPFALGGFEVAHDSGHPSGVPFSFGAAGFNVRAKTSICCSIPGSSLACPSGA